MIRTARPFDWQDIMDIYANARRFMRETGNPTQWGDTFPPEELVREDLRLGRNYVCEIDGRVQGVFAMVPGDDPTYRFILGSWLNDEPYCAVHRVASRGEVKGVASQVLGPGPESYRTDLAGRHPDRPPHTHRPLPVA